MIGAAHIYERNRAIVPTQFGIGLFYRGELTGGPLGMAEFAISDGAARALARQPEAFLARLGDGGTWKRTPVSPRSVRLGGDCATFWCLQSKPSEDAAVWFQAPGSYHRRWGNSDAYIDVVSAARKRPVLGYYYT